MRTVATRGTVHYTSSLVPVFPHKLSSVASRRFSRHTQLASVHSLLTLPDPSVPQSTLDSVPFSFYPFLNCSIPSSLPLSLIHLFISTLLSLKCVCVSGSLSYLSLPTLFHGRCSSPPQLLLLSVVTHLSNYPDAPEVKKKCDEQDVYMTQDN